MGFGTRAVHLARKSALLSATGEVPNTAPLYQTANYSYPDAAAADRAAGGQGFIYTRHGNPTNQALSEAIADLEGGEAALTFASGMAAIAAAVFAYAGGGEVLASE